jgi:hypothetical protein
MPEFAEREAHRASAKARELAPYVDAAFERKDRLKPLADEDIPSYPAYGLTIAEVDLSTLPEANRQRALVFRKMREIMERS